ncbi:hypothetical protein [Lentzea sp. NBRC 102530]|uniref:hypothetical protein n=1 Tax=Lentzea sp. NBRC 102530 TaxID=3032201 RepID=UPI0024A1D1BE|nr:hypothetical protein [Lentzea sp. NBRC 102530]GLY47533.1 hypothetical protein Lesp01_11890 [Lentzea sp. NBRC 102530]
MEALWVLVIILLLGWAIFTQVRARTQLDVTAALSEQQAGQLVMEHFGVMWSQVEGPGHLNFKPRLRKWPPTISVNFTTSGTAQCEVSIWTSHWTSHYGVMGHAQLAWRKEAALARKLSNADSAANWLKGA